MKFSNTFILLLIVFVYSTIVVGQNSKRTIDELKIEADNLLENELYYEAEDVLALLANMQQKENMQREYSITLNKLGKSMLTSGSYSAADSLFCIALPISNTEFGELSLQTADILSNMGVLNKSKQDFVKAKELLQKSMAIRKEQEGENNLKYAEDIINLAYCYVYEGQQTEARSWLDLAENIIVSNNGKTTPLYVKLLLNRGTSYYYMGDIITAQNCYTQANDIAPNIQNYKALDYSIIFGHLSVAYIKTGRYQEAEALLLGSKDIYNTILSKGHPDYAGILTNLGGLYMMTADYIKAEPILDEAMMVANKYFGKTHTYYIHALNGQSLVYQNIGLLEKAEVSFLESLKLRIEMYGKENGNTLTAMANLAVFYTEYHNLDEAYTLLNEVLEISRRLELVPNIEIALNGLGNIFYQKGELEKAYHYQAECLELHKQFVGETDIIYVRLLSTLINTIDGMPNADKKQLEQMWLDCLDLTKMLTGEKSSELVITLMNIGAFYSYDNQYDKSMKYYQEALALLPTKGMMYTKILNFEAINRFLAKDTLTSDMYYQQMLNSIKNEVKENFTFLSEKERTLFWTYNDNILDAMKSILYQSALSSQLAYNNELLTKNILLTSSNLIQQSIINSGDDTLLNKWNELKLKKSKQIQLESDSELASQSSDQIKQLTQEANELEKEITRQSKPFRDMQMGLSVSWKDVKASLLHNEMAIEFVQVDDIDLKLDSVIQRNYYALLLASDSENPLIVKCCAEKDLLAAINENDYTKINQLVWEPLNKYLDSIQTIYIAPTGLLHNISFYGLKNGDDYLADKYMLHNVLSTKDIIKLKGKENTELKNKNIVLFGGADYGLPHNELVLLDKDILLTDNRTRSFLDEVDTTRGQGFYYLPGSKQEVDQVGNLLKQYAWNPFIHTGKEATEARFKSYSSMQSPSVLHISTHAFYFPLVEKQETVKPNAEKKNVYRFSENPLLRSGLAFTGANYTWEGNKLSDKTEDGVLTAYEVSNLNLSSTKLVVLSACNTGRGDIINSEGTYGLQRAFRLAGVESMITTLWEISDKDTVSFMTTFYGEWAKNNNLKEAFTKAQNKLRNQYPNDSKKWASFVLIE